MAVSEAVEAPEVTVRPASAPVEGKEERARTPEPSAACWDAAVGEVEAEVSRVPRQGVSPVEAEVAEAPSVLHPVVLPVVVAAVEVAAVPRGLHLSVPPMVEAAAVEVGAVPHALLQHLLPVGTEEAAVVVVVPLHPRPRPDVPLTPPVAAALARPPVREP